MPNFKYVVFTKPAAGKEDAYNDWYDNQHLNDVLKIEGFVAAQRFKLVDVEDNSKDPSPYLAIYEMETDNPEAVLDRMVAAVREGTMIISEALDRDVKTYLYEPLTKRMVKEI